MIYNFFFAEKNLKPTDVLKLIRTIEQCKMTLAKYDTKTVIFCVVIFLF